MKCIEIYEEALAIDFLNQIDEGQKSNLDQPEPCAHFI